MPEASVIHRVQALSGITGRKEMRRRPEKFYVKSWCLTPESHRKLPGLRQKGERGIPGGAVKCVDIRKNTKGEGTSLVLA